MIGQSFPSLILSISLPPLQNQNMTTCATSVSRARSCRDTALGINRRVIDSVTNQSSWEFRVATQ